MMAAANSGGTAAWTGVGCTWSVGTLVASAAETVGSTPVVAPAWAATDVAATADIGTAVCTACGATPVGDVAIAVGAMAGPVVGTTNGVALAADVAAALPTGLVGI